MLGSGTEGQGTAGEERMVARKTHNSEYSGSIYYVVAGLVCHPELTLMILFLCFRNNPLAAGGNGPL